MRIFREAHDEGMTARGQGDGAHSLVDVEGPRLPRSTDELDVQIPARAVHQDHRMSRPGRDLPGPEPGLSKRALQIVPGHPLALWAQGIVLSEGKRDYAGAIRSWEAVMRQGLAPGDADAAACMLAEARRHLAARAAGSRQTLQRRRPPTIVAGSREPSSSPRVSVAKDPPAARSS